MASPDLSIVIVTHNCRKYIIECLASIFEQNGSITKEVIVIDNASSDATPHAVREFFPSAHLIQNSQNRWFRPAINQGIRISRGRYILLLNPDTRILTSDGLSRMIRYMDSRANIGILGAKLINSNGTIQEDCERFPGLGWLLCYYFLIHNFWPDNPIKRHFRYANWNRGDTRVVDTVSGACMMVRKQAFEQAGLFDETCLIYWEEAEFCRAARKLGWLTVHFADAEIIHYWGQGGTLINPSGTLKALMEQSMLRYYKIYYGEFVYKFLILILGWRSSFFKFLKAINKTI